MGTRILVDGHQFEAVSFSVAEDSTPLAAGDTSGSVGTITFTIPEPERSLYDQYGSGSRMIIDFGPAVLVGESVNVLDSEWGLISGTVTNYSRPSRGTLSYTCSTTLARLNIYNVQAQPYVGTLGGLFTYYLGLAAVTTGFAVDPFLEGRPVAVVGWYGELWANLKQLCAAQSAEIALVNNVITLRPNRVAEITSHRDSSDSQELPIPTLAQAVEVYRYGAHEIIDQLVYPPRGWNNDVQILNVNAGATAEYTLELSASVSSIQAPSMLEDVGPGYDLSSVYTIVANDGLPVPPAQWAASGGSVQVLINPDTTSLTVKLVGARGIGTSDGEEATNFSLALASDTSGSYYSTLRIVGSGVAFDRQKKRIPTGVSASETGTEIGVTIDNPFINTVDEMYRAGMRAACRFAGPTATFTGSSPNVFNDPGSQHFGGIAGARIWDRYTARWYRTRSSDISRSSTSINSAEDDNTVGDYEDFYSGTIGQHEDAFGSLTIGQRQNAGLRHV